MNIIKKKYYEKIMYPKFIENINKVWSENNILIRIIMNDDDLTIYYIIDNKILKLFKPINGDLNYTEVSLNSLIESSSLIKLDFFINDLKENGEIVNSQNVIDFISNSLKEAVAYYKLSRKENELIYATILKYKKSFSQNSPPMIIHNDEIKNKWID